MTDLISRLSLPSLDDGTPDLEAVKDRIMGNPLYAGNLVSKAGDATALVVYFNDISDRDYIRGGIHDRISAIVEEEQGNNEIFMTGSPYFKYAMVDLLVDDLIWTPPLITIILVIVLAFSFRTVSGVITPLLTVGIGVILTLGTIAALGYSLSMISVLVPPLLMILGFSYSVHVTSEYHQQRRQTGLKRHGHPANTEAHDTAGYPDRADHHCRLYRTDGKPDHCRQGIRRICIDRRDLYNGAVNHLHTRPC